MDRSSRGIAYRTALCLPSAAASSWLLVSTIANAAPNAGVVTAGNGSISQSGTTTTVRQQSSRLAIDWNSFSIGADESVIFEQPNASAIALNRITGTNPSELLGHLGANGQIFILNPNGVLFGRSAQVSVGGLVASTLSLSNADFLADRFSFSKATSTGSVVNQGTISANQGGYVAMLSSQIRNEGIVSAPEGEALLAAGDKVTLELGNGSLLGYTIDRGSLEALIENQQTIQARNGAVILSAQAADAVGAAVVNNTGIIEANAVEAQGGVIRLLGGTRGAAINSGILDASNSNGKGGHIELLGGRVAVLDGAVIDASGNGGGEILVGGDYHGANANVLNSELSFVGADATLRADALDVGGGGKIVVWSDRASHVYGALSARGGLASGDGGFIETSSKDFLEFHARVDVSAPAGQAGTLLLDPASITIVGGVGDGAASPDGTTTFQGSAVPGTVNFADMDITSAGVSNIYQSELEGLAPGTNIILEATDYISVAGSFSNVLTLPTNSNLTMRTRNAATDGSGTIGINLVSSTDSTNFEIKTQGTGSITLQTGTGASPQAAMIDVGKLSTQGGAVSLNASGNLVARSIVTTPGGGNGGNISLASGGYMMLGGGNIDARGAGGSDGDVTLNAGQAITLQTGKSLYANDVRISAAGGISGSITTDAFSVYAARLQARNSSHGDIFIQSLNTQGLVIEDFNAGGYGIQQSAPGANVTVQNTSGVLRVHGFSSVANGQFDLISDKLDIAAGIGGVGTVILRPLSGVAIDIGSAGDGGAALELSADEIGRITADVLQIGSSADAGGIQLTGTNPIVANAATLSLINQGDISETGTAGISATALRVNGAAAVTLANANSVGTLAGNFGGANDFIFQNSGALNIGTVDGSVGIAPYSGGTGNLTVSAEGDLRLDAGVAANTIVLESNGGDFINNAGTNALVSGGAGRWLVYSANPTSVVKDGLTSNFRHYGSTATTYAPSDVTETGNGFIYTATPGNLTVLTTLATGTAHNVYGTAPTATYTYTLTGFADAEDNIGNIGLSGIAAFNTPTVSSNAGNYTVTYANGLTSTLGYGFSAGAGVAYAVNRAPVSITGVAAQNRTYNGTSVATLTNSGTLTGLIGGQTLMLRDYVATFSDKNVGDGKTVTVTGYALGDGTGLASNYQLVSNTVTTTANITPLAAHVALDANDKTYDGTTAATGALVSTDVIAGDAVTFSFESATFSDKNVGNAKTVNIVGAAASGADAANYLFEMPFAGVASIAPRALTVAAMGIDKIYDGLLSATVTLSDDRIAGDVFDASYVSASYGDAQIGRGKPITVNGIALAGDDAENYVFNTTAVTTGNILSASVPPSILAYRSSLQHVSSSSHAKQTDAAAARDLNEDNDRGRPGPVTLIDCGVNVPGDAAATGCE